MLIPDKNRLDYGEQLIAPEGYEITNVIATTFSLDLNTLLTVPIAMCFGHTLEGSVEHMRIALLDALSTLGNKLTVFYQQGNIKVPEKYNSLFGLLEKCLVPVVPNSGYENSAFSSFHPKVWLLRFASKDPEANIKYRLMVLSRNLTFDRSWDLCAVIDGESRGNRKLANRALISFFDEVYRSSHERDFSDVIDPEELMRVLWKKPDNVLNLDFLSSIFEEGKRKRPIDIPFSSQAMLAVSPFIRGGSRVDALDWLQNFAPVGKRYLFSRKEELDLAGEKALAGWNCYSFNEHLVNAEELEEMEQSQFVENDLNLHAKLLVIDENAAESTWHLGSANITQAALGDFTHAPRNTEFMLRLTGDPKYMGVQALIKQWVNPENTGLFVKHEFSVMQDNQDDISERELRQLTFELIRTKWYLKVEPCEDNYKLILDAEPISLPDHFNIKVSTLSILQPRDLAERVEWDKLKLSQISALLRFDIVQDDIVVQHIVTQANLSFPNDLDRYSAISKELLANSSQFMDYISMLLQINPSKQDLFDSQTHQNSNGVSAELFDSDSVIFEKLMRAAAVTPELFERIDKLQSQVDESIIPQQFKKLWCVFSQLIEKKMSKQKKYNK